MSEEEEFRAKVLEIIKSNYDRETASLLRYDIENTLLKNTPISLPDEFLKDWLLTTNEGKMTAEDIEQQYEGFTRSVKLQLIKNKVAEQNDIDVKYEDVLEATKAMVREQFGFYGDNEQMSQSIDRIAQNYLMEEKGDNYMKIFNRVFDDRVVDLIRSKANIEPKSITVEEFKELVQNRNNG